MPREASPSKFDGLSWICHGLSCFFHALSWFIMVFHCFIMVFHGFSWFIIVFALKMSRLNLGINQGVSQGLPS
jgi:hypothetical protein